MLDILRKKSSTFLMYFVFAILIVVFAVGFGAVAPDQACGGGPPGTLKNVDLVQVDGEVIDASLARMAMALTGDEPDPKRGFGNNSDERYRYYSRYVYMNLYGPFSGGLYGADPERASPIKLLKVIDDLVETKLVSKWARDMGLGVSEAELNDALALLLSNDAFRDQETGALDVTAYRNWVSRSLESTVAAFERLVEDELLREKVVQLLVGEIGVSDEAIERSYRLENDTVAVEVIAIDERSASPLVAVSDEDVAKWLESNDETVKEQYENLKATRYTTPKTFELRGISIVAPNPEDTDDEELKKGYEEERAAAKERAEAILAEVEKVLAEKVVPEVPEGEEPPAFDPYAAFAKIATEKSDDDSKDEGGKLASATLEALGVSPYGDAVKAAAETMKAGEVTGLLEVPTGFWILMPEAIHEEKVDTYDDVKNEIARALLQRERAPDTMKALADEVLAEAKKDPEKKLGEVAGAVSSAHGAEDRPLIATEISFSRLSRMAAGYPASTPYLMGLGGRAPDLVRKAFAATAEAPLLDEVFSVGDGRKLVVARFVEKRPAEEIDDETKKSLRDQLTLDRRRAVYRGWYEDILTKKRAAGELRFTDAYAAERRRVETNYLQAGGKLVGMTAPPPGEGAESATP